MAYVDGFVVPVPRRKLAQYRRIAQQAGKVWRKCGALEYRECVGDDMKVTWGKSFPKMARVKSGETVVFSWIVYKSRGDRDRVNQKVMKDPWMKRAMEGPMPFDVKRMAYGGFKVIVDR
jgi:alkaline phosphatase